MLQKLVYSSSRRVPRQGKGLLTSSLRLVCAIIVIVILQSLTVTTIAKKIPIEHILASTRGGAGRPGASGSRAGAQEGGVNLEDNGAKTKDACNC